jgi:hypothetical protein
MCRSAIVRGSDPPDAEFWHCHCARPDRGPHRYRDRRTRRRACRCARHDHVAGADWRPGDARHERQRAAAIPVFCLRASTRSRSNSRIRTSLRRRVVRIGAGATIERTVVMRVAGFASVVVQGVGTRIEAETRIRNAFRSRTSTRFRRDEPACTTSSGPPPACRRLRRQQYRDDHLRVRLRHQRKPVSHRWHEHDLSVQWRRATEQVSISFTKCRSPGSERRPSSATCRAP